MPPNDTPPRISGASRDGLTVSAMRAGVVRQRFLRPRRNPGGNHQLRKLPPLRLQQPLVGAEAGKQD